MLHFYRTAEDTLVHRGLFLVRWVISAKGGVVAGGWGGGAAAGLVNNVSGRKTMADSKATACQR